jgi:class 3 adenylate cyclase
LLRHASVIAFVALLAAGFLQTLVTQRADGLTIDSLFWLRHHIFGPLRPAAESPTVVVAIDEETYRRPPFQDIPKAMWTPQIAQVLEAVLDAGALVIGQDVILPTSVEPYLKGFDRSYLLAVRRGARSGKLVLGKVQHLKKPLAPYRGHSFAVGHQENIRLVNLFTDQDGVIRRLPLLFRSTNADGSSRTESSMALELAARALGETSQVLAEDGRIGLAGYDIPGASQNAMLLNFETGEGDIPTYSLADLHACVEAGDEAFFRRHFEGKVVLFGGVLDVEDRKLTSKRYVTGPESPRSKDRCRLTVMADLYDERVVRDTIPGTYIFATAVNNLLRKDALRALPGSGQFLLVFLVGLTAGVLGFRFRPALAAGLVGGIIVLGVFAATYAFKLGLVVPLIDSGIAALICLVVAGGYRFGITDREKRAVRRAFSYYLPELVIDRMLAQGAAPKLGGEDRDVSVLFSDLADFTALSEGLAPEEVVTLMNRYLNAMTEIIEAHGGFVDKYIGDAIVAVFGAPLSDPEHARHAVEAALACRDRLTDLQPELGLPPGRTLSARIGVNSGPVLIGNIGSQKRFNYTVMGDTVNLAARLEGVNKLYRSSILVSGITMEQCGTGMTFREIDRVRVLGRSSPVTLFEPLYRSGSGPLGDPERLAIFAAALDVYRSGDFAKARMAFEGLATNDPVAAELAQRCRVLIDEPPSGGWDGVCDLDRK